MKLFFGEPRKPLEVKYIPEGFYCYKVVDGKMKICPFWDRDDVAESAEFEAQLMGMVYTFRNNFKGVNYV